MDPGRAAVTVVSKPEAGAAATEVSDDVHTGTIPAGRTCTPSGSGFAVQ
ncbi:MAG: hypothetical protein ACRDL7_07480 [Gaiellaceae bacterium]